MGYLTISNKAEFEQKIKRSRFICHLFPIVSEAEAKDLIGAHQQEYANATHNCFAYVLGFGRELQYYSDAGEPRGTAGKPILNALLRNGLTNVLAIVTRYYGGVKLGVRGLIEAYGETVDAAIGTTVQVAAIALAEIAVSLDYAQVDPVRNAAKNAGGEVILEQWAERVELTLRVPEESLPGLREFLDGLKLHGRLDYQVKEN